MKDLWKKNEGFRMLIFSVGAFFVFFSLAIVYYQCVEEQPKTCVIGLV